EIAPHRCQWSARFMGDIRNELPALIVDPFLVRNIMEHGDIAVDESGIVYNRREVDADGRLLIIFFKEHQLAIIHLLNFLELHLLIESEQFVLTCPLYVPAAHIDHITRQIVHYAYAALPDGGDDPV